MQLTSCEVIVSVVTFLNDIPSFASKLSLTTDFAWCLQRTYPTPIVPPMEPPEDSIATLVSMGFDRNAARQALVQARNDINAATNILIESQ